MITYNVDGVKMPKIKKRETTAWIRAVAATYGYKVGEVGYMFVDDEKILEVNNEYLGHDYYTDVITFDYDEPGIVSGDIVISLDTVRTNAEKFGKQYDDELHRVIIHGILHLFGINDKGGERRPTSYRLLPHRLRRRGMEDYARAGHLGTERIRRP
jgi:probable rRNA maturation factor